MDDKRREALLALREYPAMKRMAAELRSELECRKGEGSKRPTEDAVQRLADEPRLCRWERTAAAVERVLAAQPEEDRRLVELVYWRGSHSVTGASMAVYRSPATAYRRLSGILSALERELEK